MLVGQHHRNIEMTFTFKTLALDVKTLAYSEGIDAKVDAFCDTLRYKGNTWGEVNACQKFRTKCTLEVMGLPYTKELGKAVRDIVDVPYTEGAHEWLISHTIEDAMFDDYGI